MLEIQHAKEIAGAIKLPPDPDLFMVGMCMALASQKAVSISPVLDTPLVRSYIAIMEKQVDVIRHETTCTINPGIDASAPVISLSDTQLPYPEFCLFLLLGLRKTIIFKTISEKRLEHWQRLCTRLGCTLRSKEFDQSIGIYLDPESKLTVSEEVLDPNMVHPYIGLALGLQINCVCSIDQQFQSPLRYLLPAFGYNLTVKSNYEKKDTGLLARRLRFLAPKLIKKTDSKLLFTVSVSGKSSAVEPINITLPGDDILGSILLAAKSLIPKGHLILENMPLETWSGVTVNTINKMGCKSATQEERQTSAGASGLLSIQKFSLSGHKLNCSPLYHYQRQLPALVVIATFAKGQSVFRGLEELQLDVPDTIEQMLACVRLLGGRHGEMPDGMVIDGAKENDGFDVTESYSAALNGACAIAGLKCNGKTTIEDTAILDRWPSFKELLDSVCTYR